MTTLKNWSIVYKNAHIAPELQKPCLNGNVYNHPNSDRFPDGKRVTTSNIKNIIERDRYKEVQTCNTTYIIYPEDVNSEYERQYPNAFDRLLFTKN